MEDMEIGTPRMSESDTWVMEPSADWPVFMAGDPEHRLLNAIPDQLLPRCTPRTPLSVKVDSLEVDSLEVDDLEPMDTSNTHGIRYYLNAPVMAIRHIFSMPANAMYRLWTKLWVRSDTETDADDDEDEPESETETTTRVIEDSEAALGSRRPVYLGRAATLAAAASDLDRRLARLPSSGSAAASSSSPAAETSTTTNRSGQIKTADVNRLAETLKLRLAAVSPWVIERSEDPATGLLEYVDEREILHGEQSTQRLVPKYIQDKRTQKLELRNYVTVETIPGFISTAF